MNLKNEKGSITIFVLIGLLFMTAFLIIAYGANVNNSKIVKEQFNIISDIYMPNDNIVDSYTEVYTDLRKKNKQILSYDSEKEGLISVSEVELDKTYADKVTNYIIYGNSIQNGIPTIEKPVEIQSVGDLVTDEADDYYGKYKIPIKISNTDEERIYNIYLDEPLRKIEDAVDYIDFKEKRVYRNIKSVIYKADDMNNPDPAWPGWLDFSIIDDFGLLVNAPISEKVPVRSNILRDNSLIGVNTMDTRKPVIFFRKEGNTLSQEEWINIYGTQRDSEGNITKEGLEVNICYKKAETIEEIELPELDLFEDDTKIEILTTIEPARVVIDYTGFTID